MRILPPPPNNEWQHSINSFCGGSVSYTATNCIALFLNWVFNGQSFQYVFVYNFPNMNAMSHRSYLFLLIALETIFENQLSTLLQRIFDNLSSRMTQLPNCHHDVGFKICRYLIVRGYDDFQKWRCLDSWFERPSFAKYIGYLVGLYVSGLKAFHCLELFYTCACMAFLFALWNWGDWQPWHYIYRLSSSSLPSIRTWDQLNGEKRAGKSAHCKVERINHVGS